MAVPPIAKATLQAALINAGSNVLAQGIKAYRADVNIESLMQFTTCAFITSPLSYLWLGTLESWFPGRAPDSKNTKTDNKGDEKNNNEKRISKPSLNVTNTVAKIVIDQAIGGAWNTVLFIVTMGMLRGLDYDTITGQIQADFWSIMIAGWKLWPLVSILNFTVVPAGQRLLVGNLFGVVWAIYLSLMS
ncbi:Mpv17/PMP22, partial [Penicillium coprophilum]|uniref:Mpv17/PMP22 n=1 Tax=Penicillium coprophilum TaxID=36646 RepID=UPI002386CC77